MKEKNTSIQFTEWLSENEWVKRTLTHPNKVGKYYSHKHCEYKSIEELYDLFEDSLNTNNKLKLCSNCGGLKVWKENNSIIVCSECFNKR